MDHNQIIEHYRGEGVSKNISFEGTNLSVREFEGSSDEDVTLIGVAGGPGGPKQHMAPLSTLSKDGYDVVLYDQHNVGKSGDHANPYSMETFVDELEQVVSNYETPVVVGHSWGAILALEYVTKKDDLSGAVTVAPLFDTNDSIQIARTRRAEIIDRKEADLLSKLETDEPESFAMERINNEVDSVLGFNTEAPRFLERWVFDEFNEDMYEQMWGDSEYGPTKNCELSDWSVKSSLDDIECPVLMVTGIDDGFGYHDLFYARNRMSCDSTVDIIDEASHTPTWEKPTEFRRSLIMWLSKTVFDS